jgi:16S rRNA processing protein RimM
MEKSDCTVIGRIIKTFGYKGELSAQIDIQCMDALTREAAVFIETDEELVPYFVENIEHSRQNFFFIKFEDIDDVGAAKVFCGKDAWMPRSVLPATAPIILSEEQIRGYSVNDEAYGLVGIADTIVELPEQRILRILNGDKEILLPVNETFVIRTNHAAKRIDIKAPGGLIDFYLK